MFFFCWQSCSFSCDVAQPGVDFSRLPPYAELDLLSSSTLMAGPCVKLRLIFSLSIFLRILYQSPFPSCGQIRLTCFGLTCPFHALGLRIMILLEAGDIFVRPFAFLGGFFRSKRPPRGTLSALPIAFFPKSWNDFIYSSALSPHSLLLFIW